MDSVLDLLRSESLRMDETAPATSLALRRGVAIFASFGVLSLQFFRPRRRRPNTLCKRISDSDGHDRQRLLDSFTRGTFCLRSRPRMGLQTQNFWSFSRRRQRLLRLSDMDRRRRGRCPQVRNLDRSRLIFLNGVQGFPFHAPGLPRQRLQPSQKLSLGGFGSGGPDGRDFHGGRRRRPQSGRAGRPRARRARNIRPDQLRVGTWRTLSQRQRCDVILGAEIGSST